MTTYFLILLSYVLTVESARILAMFSAPSISHQFVFHPFTNELIKRGHELVVITPDPVYPKERTPANLTEIDIHDVSYEQWRQIHKIQAGKIGNTFSDTLKYAKLYYKIFKDQFNNKEVQTLIKNRNEHFDLLIVEACIRVTLGLSQVFKAPVIQFSSFGAILGNYEVVGAPTHPIIYPTSLSRRVYNLSFWDKMTLLFDDIKLKILFTLSEYLENMFLRELFGEDTPPISELQDNVDLLFLNVHPIWTDNRPVPPNVIYIGGLHQKPPMALPKDIETYLNSSKSGVIYFSFGTNVDTKFLPRSKIEIFLKVFSDMPFNVLWKWDDDELPEKPDNVITSKWWPQPDILRHPNIKVFITQGGLQSADEAIMAGVPLIGIPMLGDQWYNVEKYVYHNIGVAIDFDSLTEENLKKAIKTVSTDQNYRYNIARLRSIMYDQPQNPLERVIWWTEHVLRHGGAKHLRAPAANISWAEYYEVQLILFVLTFLFTLIGLFFKVLIITRRRLKSISAGSRKKKS